MMLEGRLVAQTSRRLERSIDQFVARIVARAPAVPEVRAAFVRALVAETCAELGRAIHAYVDRAHAGPARSMTEGPSLGFANLVLAPTRVAEVMRTTTARCGLSQREADVLTAALCGIPRKHLARVLDVTENTIKTTVRHAIQKTGHQNLDDAVWWLRMQRGRSKGS